VTFYSAYIFLSHFVSSTKIVNLHNLLNSIKFYINFWIDMFLPNLYLIYNYFGVVFSETQLFDIHAFFGNTVHMISLSLVRLYKGGVVLYHLQIMDHLALQNGNNKYHHKIIIIIKANSHLHNSDIIIIIKI
ncbi:hypothetical protein ACJX0J_037227, partial [Zea mays]